MSYLDDFYKTAVNEPQVGCYLHASCSAEDYGRIVGIGKDDNGIPTIDIEVFYPNDLLDIQDVAETGEQHGLTTLEIPGGVKPILRYVQYKISESKDPSYPNHIICSTPSGCFRCVHLFTMFTDSKEERWAR